MLGKRDMFFCSARVCVGEVLVERRVMVKLDILGNSRVAPSG